MYTYIHGVCRVWGLGVQFGGPVYSPFSYCDLDHVLQPEGGPHGRA